MYVSACDCNDNGSDSSICYSSGQCVCKTNVIGKKCTHCKSGYFGFPNCRGTPTFFKNYEQF